MLLPASRIASAVQSMARHVAERHAAHPFDVMVPLLNGSLVLVGDLLRELAKLDVHLPVTPMLVARVRNGFYFYVDFWSRVNGKSVLLVDDILDTGKTSEFCFRQLMVAGANWVEAVFLISRWHPPRNPRHWAAVNLEGCSDYLVGYGLDRNGLYRGLPDIWGEPPSEAVADSQRIATEAPDA